MSPASRGRKAKKRKKRPIGRPGAARGTTGGARGSGGTAGGQLASLPAGAHALAGSRRRPAWFDSSIRRVLDRAGVVMAARGPRELEQATAELLGAELHRVIGEEDHGMWFDWWFGELAEAAAARVRGDAAGAWQAPWRLLHGLTSIGSPALASIAQTAIGRAGGEASKAQQADAKRQQPAWLWKLPMITATGEIWQMHDVHGTRLAVVAGFSYPGATDSSVFLFDIDACGPVSLAGAGVYADVSQAAAAWRALVGEAAGGAQPAAVETADDLRCLVDLDIGEETVVGTETRAVTDNWFRARRRVHDLAGALGRRGLALPEAGSVYHGIGTPPMAEAYARWHHERHDAEPDGEAVVALTEQWLEGTLPGTEHSASPHRVAVQLDLIDDWREDDPVTLAVKALLPEWVRWHCEQAGLPEPLVARSVAVAAGEEPRAASDCPAARL